MTTLGSDWVPDEDGIPHREAARAVIYSPSGKILLLHGHDGHGPDHSWWFTVGGGIEPGETPIECVLREVDEEIGLKIEATELIGPVLFRQAEFRFLNVHARQDEWFYLVFLESDFLSLDGSKRTPTEHSILDEHKWVSPEEMVELAKSVPVYPIQLPEFTKSWWAGWDGNCLVIKEDERKK